MVDGTWPASDRGVEEHPGRERRGVDRPIKRLRQLLARLDVLLAESQALRNTDALDRLTWPALAQADALVSVIDR